jgi:hypothetical protein
MTIWNILRTFGLFMTIWYILCSFGFGIKYQEKSGNPGTYLKWSPFATYVQNLWDNFSDNFDEKNPAWYVKNEVIKVHEREVVS